MKRYIFLIWILILTIPLFAQLEVKPGSFKEVPGFVNINPDENYQTDDNDLPFAVIKVRTENINDKQRRELNFSGNAGTFIMLEYKDGEVWVYLTAQYADYLKISHPDLSSIEFIIPEDLKPRCGYELTLINTSVITYESWGSLTIISEPKNGANITLNGKELNTKTPYTNDMIPVGKYEITLSMDQFKPTTKIIDINDGDNVLIKIEMTSDNGETYEEGTINGIFSVSPHKMVKFSKGNLQYQASTKTWRFAEHQWDIIGRDNMYISKKYSGWIDLFGWSTSGFKGKNPYMTSTNSNAYGCDNIISGTNYDWGVYNNILNGGNNEWHTLTCDEWVYIFQERKTSSGIRFVKATVNDVQGVVILPDDWNTNNYSFIDPNTNNASFFSNNISETIWINYLEAYGAVFLPAAGGRNGKLVLYNGLGGFYWSATYSKDGYAYLLYFVKETLQPDYIDRREFGLSVRLVQDY